MFYQLRIEVEPKEPFENLFLQEWCMTLVNVQYELQITAHYFLLDA